MPALMPNSTYYWSAGTTTSEFTFTLIFSFAEKRRMREFVYSRIEDFNATNQLRASPRQPSSPQPIASYPAPAKYFIPTGTVLAASGYWLCLPGLHCFPVHHCLQFESKSLTHPLQLLHFQQWPPLALFNFFISPDLSFHSFSDTVQEPRHVSRRHGCRIKGSSLSTSSFPIMTPLREISCYEAVLAKSFLIPCCVNVLSDCASAKFLLAFASIESDTKMHIRVTIQGCLCPFSLHPSLRIHPTAFSDTE